MTSAPIILSRCCALVFWCLTNVCAADQNNSESQTTAPARGAIHSDQLQRTMKRLNELAYDREYTELGLDRLRAEQIAALVTAAAQLRISAGRLPELLSAGEMSAEEQATFAAIAGQLHAEAQNIQAAVRAYQFDRLPAGYRRLQRICNACHALFREDR
jgi:cytochrome c556